ncbi:MAG TPA: hypothetical protein VM282_01325 [Acidimicrobiales bacterium]|nr:hypothetical protein [Acidimicrobiales bacterium]
MSNEADEGSLSAASNVTISELIESWLDIVDTDPASATIDGDRNLVPAAEEGAVVIEGTQVHAVVRRARKHAVKWGWISINPALNATPPRQDWAGVAWLGSAS